MDLLQDLGYLALASRLKRLGERLQLEVAQTYAELGVEMTPSWFPLLRAVARRGERTIGELALDLGQSHLAVVKGLRPLEKRKLVSTTDQPADVRRRTVTLSARGEALIERLLPTWGAIEAATRDLVEESAPQLLAEVQAVEHALELKTLRLRMPTHLGIEIVPYRSDLAGSFRSLNRAWIEGELGLELEEPDREILENPGSSVVAAGGEILFARRGAEVVGCCAVVFHDLADRAIAELTKMAVTRNHRGRGIGTALTTEAIRLSARVGCDSIFLFTSVSLAAAMALYRRLGFVEVAAPPVAHPGYQRPSVVLMRHLAPSPDSPS